MNSALALTQLRQLGVPAFTTSDARALFGESTATASKTLARLARAGAVIPVAHGLWTLEAELDPFVLTDFLTAPAPSYVSLQTALYRRGVIEQIPAAIYVVTLGRAEIVKTTAGTFSMHKVPPELFGGFDVLENGARLASAEKAIVDFLYLSGTRNRRFAALPEIELPRGFNRRKVVRWIGLIPSTRHRVLARRRFTEWIEPHLASR